MRGYYFITDAALSRRGNAADVQDAVAAGVAVVQYRRKTGAGRELLEEARLLKDICAQVTFLINDRVDIALAVDADGVHLGQDDLPVPIARNLLGTKKIIGVTVNSLAQALAAQREGADYVALAPVFPTLTKADAGAPAGLAVLRDIKKQLDIPVVAIGGITLENAPRVIDAGADALCAISSVLGAEDVRREIGKFQQLFSGKLSA